MSLSYGNNEAGRVDVTTVSSFSTFSSITYDVANIASGQRALSLDSVFLWHMLTVPSANP